VWRNLCPEVDGMCDGVHGERMTTDEETAKVDLLERVQLSVQVGDLPDVVTDR